MNVQPKWLKLLIEHTKTLNHGLPPGISNFLKHNVQTMFLAQKIVCEWLCKYIIETRKAVGSEYIPHSLHVFASFRHIVVCTQGTYILRCSLICSWITSLHPSRIYVFRIQKASLQRHWSFLDNNSCFVCRQWKEVMEYKCHELENSYRTSAYMQFFYIGKNFCLQGSAEQHNLKLSQFREKLL